MSARPRTGCAPAPPTTPTTYPDFDRLVRSLGGFLADLAATTPPDIAAPGFADAITGLKLGRSFRGLGRRDGRTVLRVLPMAVADLVAESFETDALRAAIATRGVLHSATGPWSAGLGVHAAGRLGRQRRGSGRPDGLRPRRPRRAVRGPRLVAHERRAARSGPRPASPGSRERDGRATGVALESGEEIAATVVVAGIDPKRLLTRLVDPVTLGPTLAWRAGNIRTAGTVAKVNLALAGLPRFTAAGDDGEHLLRGRILLAPGIDAMERAFDASKYGRMSEHPMLEATIPSLVDPSLVAGAELGRRKGPAHVMSVIAQWMPFTLRDGDWDSQRDALGDLVVRELETVAPGIGKQIVARQVITPLDLERDYGLTGGHPFHGELGLDQFFLWRPLLGHARYRMPLEGLYLAGSGRPSRRRDHRRARRERRSRDPGRREAPALIALSRRRVRRPRATTSPASSGSVHVHVFRRRSRLRPVRSRWIGVTATRRLMTAWKSVPSTARPDGGWPPIQ